MTEATSDDIRRHNESEVDRAQRRQGPNYTKWSIATGTAFILTMFGLSFVPEYAVVPNGFRAALLEWTGTLNSTPQKFH
jgi:hypothetical protein